MANDDDGWEERLERWLDSSFLEEWRASGQTLEDFAFLYYEGTTTRTQNDPLAHALDEVERIACVGLALVVEGLSEDVTPEEALAWGRTEEALAGFLALLPLTEGNRTGVLICAASLAALGYAEMCRSEIDAGEADSAAYTMHQAHRAIADMRRVLSDKPLSTGLRWHAAADRGRKGRARAAAGEHQIWRGELQRLTLRCPNWSRTRIAKEIGANSTPPRSVSHVLRVLREIESKLVSEAATKP